ncbi:helix-turn-helix domain-containing protein [Bacillus cereus group sp. BfR-BA-01318]|uniref:helix-turn-helix domain-containing protein n=1 Tax=Bacillus cereus group sp. BfR-BA-01318 TaxID=2920295 RepID=UPI001F5897D0|nr:helix-turn-helix domain-containing protein [Bacillus cereus group sp. BfR-BA-01318]
MTKRNPLSEIMGVVEAAELWGLSAARVKGLCQAGKVKCKKIGNSWVLVKNQPNPKSIKKNKLGGTKNENESI